MREIKFRAFLKKSKKNYKVHAIDFGVMICNLEEEFGEGSLISATFSEIVLMRYTGLEDNNGVLSYEFDIVEDIDTGEIGMIEFIDGCFVFKKDETKHNLELLRDRIFIVIGNKHENPELLNIIKKEAKNEKIKNKINLC